MGRGHESKAARSQNRAVAAGRSTRGCSSASFADIQNDGRKGKRRTKGQQHAEYYTKKLRHDDNNYTIEYRFENEDLHIGDIFKCSVHSLPRSILELKSKIITDNNLIRLLAHKLMITLMVEQAQAQA